MKSLVLAIGALLPTIVVGCGSGGDAPETGAVTGIVTLDGEPVAGATVVFKPKQGRSSTGRTDAEGRYTLRYTAGIEGAKLGEHEVTITTFSAPSPYGGEAERQGRAEEIPEKYATKKPVVSVDSEVNTIDFKLTSS